MTDAEFAAWRREQINTFPRYVKRLSAFRNYVRRELRRDPTGDLERDLASQRATSAIWSLSWVLHTLADENAPQEQVKKAISAADAAYRAASLNGKPHEQHAAMQLVVAIRDAASEVLSGDLSIEDVRFRREFFGSDWPVSVDDDAFRKAVRAWVVSEAPAKRGRGAGRVPEKWRPIQEAARSAGLNPPAPQSIRKALKRRESRKK